MKVVLGVNRVPPLEAAPIVRTYSRPRAACPLIFCAEHFDRKFGRVGVSRDAVLIEIFSGFLDL